ncbi:MAG: sugar phosphate nucleotidyltransferase [Actinomycetota bacterium]|nr:sugar phosphate nucleotidyltransferase [Actinomycetota bacterium]
MSEERLQAVVMAGGEGSRLRPLTSNMPKPMLPVANRPLMEHIVMLLKEHGITDVVATVQFLSSVIRNYFGDGSDLDVSLSYSTEEVPLGTAGSVLNARDLLSGTFLVISGDALTDIDLTDVVRWHKDRGAAATIVLKPMNDPLEFGVVMTDEEGRVGRFLEKPSWGQVFSDTVNTGIYVIEPEVLDLIPLDQPYDFSSELFPAMLDKGLPIYGYSTDAYWTDVGNTEAYLQAHYDVLSRSVDIEPPGFELQPGVWVGEDVEIDRSAELKAPVLIGDSSRIGAGACVGPHATIGDNVIVRADARIRNAAVMDNAHIGPAAQVLGGILCRGVSLERGATMEEGGVAGEDVSVGAGALVKSGVKIYPSRSVEAGAIVTQSVVRERRAGRSLFGTRGVTGLVNVGMTPQTAVRLGMAYGSTLKRPGVVVCGRDASRAARTMKRALVAGLNSTGVTCHDLELMPMPITRFATRSEQASGGVSVRTSPSDPEMVEIRIFDGEGADLGVDAQRKIDRVFFREDYRRAGPLALGELEFPPHTVERYVGGLLRELDVEAIRRRRPKVVVDYAYGAASITGPAIIGRLGCDALALNSFVDESRPVLAGEEILPLIDRLADHVRHSGSDLGVLLEPGGEVAHVVDDKGDVVNREQALLAFLAHQVAQAPGEVAVPVSAPAACADLAEAAGGKVHWTQLGLGALMGRAAGAEVTFAGNAEGTLMFPRFLPAPDAVMTFCKALELISVRDASLSEFVADLPEVFVARRSPRVPSDKKGAVMRGVASAVRDAGRLVLFDGVKVLYEDRWALVVPSNDEPVCHVWSEAPEQAAADELAEDFVRRIEALTLTNGQEET